MNKAYEAMLEPYFQGVRFPGIHGNRPLVSILFAYYNHAGYLEEFLDSLTAQTYGNWELLFVDDVSPDTEQALDILRRYPDPRIRYRRLEKNSGAAAARTTGFHLSHGEYIVCFDPDDIMHPWFLQALMAQALSDAAPDIVMMDHLLIGSKTGYQAFPLRTEKELTLRNWITGVSLAKRKLWEATGGQSRAEEIRYGSQDWEFWLHCAEKCGPLSISRVPLPLMLYRQHARSISSKRDCFEYRVRERILRDHPDIFRKYGTDRSFLAKGYVQSFLAASRAHDAEGTSVIARRARAKLPARTLCACLLKIVLRQSWLRLRHMGRKYVLDPLGLFPKLKTMPPA